MNKKFRRLATIGMVIVIGITLLACTDKKGQQQQPQANQQPPQPKQQPQAQDGQPDKEEAKKVVKKATDKKKEAKKEIIVAKIGEEVTFDNDSTWIVLDVDDRGNSLKSNNQFKKDAQTDGKFVIVKFKVSNLTNKEERLFAGPKLIDSQGRQFNHYDSQNFYIPKGAKTMSLEAIPAGLPREFYAIYEVPADANGFRFQTRDLKSVFSPDYKLIDLGF